MENKDYIDYIKKSITSIFEDAKLEKIQDKNQPNNNFLISFKINKDIVQFVKDRGYIETEIISNQDYIPLFTLNRELKNLKLSFENIDKVIVFLNSYYR